MNTKFEFHYDVLTDRVQVFATAPCGREDHVAEVLEPYSENPGLELHVPFGFSGIKEIIRVIEDVYHSDNS